MAKVFVTGANGYIAAELIKQLIGANHSVVGTVRSKDKGEFLKKNLGNKFSYEIVTSLVEEGAFDKALQAHPDVTVFLHTASPVIFGVDDPVNDVIRPAIDGTLNALKAAKAYGKNLKHFTYTSSTAAVYNTRTQKGPVTKTEQDWNDVTYEEAATNEAATYAGSKTLAEKAAWEFIDKEKPQFTFNVVNPVYVFGPQAFAESAAGGLNFSAGIVQLILLLKEGGEIPSYQGTFVDVRDVAKLHIVSFENKDVVGKRLIAGSEYFDFELVANVIRKHFPAEAKLIPKVSLEDERAVRILIDNLATTKLSGIKWIDLEKSVVDTVKQLLAAN